MNKNNRISNSNMIDGDGFTLVVGRRNRKKLVPTSEKIKPIPLKNSKLKSKHNSSAVKTENPIASKQIGKNSSETFFDNLKKSNHLSNSNSSTINKNWSKNEITEIVDTKFKTHLSPITPKLTKPIETNITLPLSKETKNSSKNVNQEKDTKLLSTIVKLNEISIKATATSVTTASQTTSKLKKKIARKVAVSDTKTPPVITSTTSSLINQINTPTEVIVSTTTMPVPVTIKKSSSVSENAVSENSVSINGVPENRVFENLVSTADAAVQTNDYQYPFLRSHPAYNFQNFNNNQLTTRYGSHYGYQSQVFLFPNFNHEAYAPVVTDVICYQDSAKIRESLPKYDKIFHNRGYLYYNTNSEIGIIENICFQVEYYFSDDNLRSDRFLRQNMNKEGFVAITLIASFKKISVISNDINLIIHAVKTSKKLEVNDKYMVRTISNPTVWVLPSVSSGSNVWFTSIPSAPLSESAKIK